MTPEHRRELAEKTLKDLRLSVTYNIVGLERAFLSLEREVREECAKVCDAAEKEFSFRSSWNLIRYVRAWQARDDAAAIRAELKGDGK